MVETDTELAARIREARAATNKAIDEARAAGLHVGAFYNVRPGSEEAAIVTILISRDGVIL